MNTCKKCRFFDLCLKAGGATDDSKSCDCFEPIGRLMYTIEDSEHGVRTLYHTVIRDCSNFYELLGTGNRACEVEARGTIKHGAGVCVTDQLYIVRELSRVEINRGLYTCYGDSEGNGGNGCRLGYRFGYGNGIADGYGLGNGDGAVNGKGDGNGYGDGGGYGDGDGEGNGNGDGDGNEVITRVLNFK
ncbi:hypothetical protein IJI69_00230 [Candidatus Saccharibacteria bacterium]|nr:hypothetical protein [Candidatus Saccharibacteria bacterium]